MKLVVKYYQLQDDELEMIKEALGFKASVDKDGDYTTVSADVEPTEIIGAIETIDQFICNEMELHF